jgi:hypothetical protein
MKRRDYVKFILVIATLLSLIGAGVNTGDAVLWLKVFGALGTPDAVETHATILSDDPGIVRYQYSVANAQVYQGDWEEGWFLNIPSFQPFTIEYLPQNPNYSLPSERYWGDSFREEMENAWLTKFSGACWRSIFFAVAMLISGLTLRSYLLSRPS